MRYGYWTPVFGGWLRNVADEGMEASWAYTKKLTQDAEAWGYDLTLIAELNLNDIKGVESPALDAWSTAAALAAVAAVGASATDLLIGNCFPATRDEGEGKSALIRSSELCPAPPFFIASGRICSVLLFFLPERAVANRGESKNWRRRAGATRILCLVRTWKGEARDGVPAVLPALPG